MQNILLSLMMTAIICFIFAVFDDGRRKRLFRVMVIFLLLLTIAVAAVESDTIRTMLAVCITPVMFGIGMYIVIRSPQF